MKKRELHVRIVAILLIGIGLGLCSYKVRQLGLPLRPGENTETWTVQAQVSLHSRGGPVQARLLIPKKPPGFVVLDEDFISGGFGLVVEEDGGDRRASWAKRRAAGEQYLYYRLALTLGESSAAPGPAPKATYPPKATYKEPYGSAVRAVLDGVREESADIASFTRELLLRLNSVEPDENVDLIRDSSRDASDWALKITEILRGARIPSRVAHGLSLGDSRNDARLEPLLAVFNGKKWIYFDPATGRRGMPDEFLLWHEGLTPLLSAEGVAHSEVRFAVTRSVREVVEVARKRAGHADSRLIQFSLLSLPINVQNVYRVLLMVPIGALLIVVLRNIIGLRTFGTFMPVLMGLAFRETQLLAGIAMFVMLVGVGLLFRFYLEELRLLLVPRLAAVLTIVVMLMVVVSIVSAQTGMQRGLSVALFPMVILAMVIERMSIVWEEHGPGEALIQGVGSLIVASLGYLAMTDELMSHLMFVFPELLLVVLGILLLLGRYTGYRLSELWRFRSAVEASRSNP